METEHCPRGGYVCYNRQCGTTQSHGCNGNNCPCDILAQNCPFSLRCYPHGPTVADGQCYEPGVRSEGDACREPPLGGPDSCAGPLVCVFASENDSTGVCLALCETDSDCATGLACYLLDAAWGVCVAATPPPPPPPCDPLAQNCRSGELCTPVDIGPNACVPAGTAGEGAACGVASDCAPGLACAAVGGTSPTLFALNSAYLSRSTGECKRLCATARDCSAAQSCESIYPSNTGVRRTDVGLCD